MDIMGSRSEVFEFILGRGQDPRTIAMELRPGVISDGFEKLFREATPTLLGVSRW